MRLFVLRIRLFCVLGLAAAFGLGCPADSSNAGDPFDQQFVPYQLMRCLAGACRGNASGPGPGSGSVGPSCTNCRIFVTVASSAPMSQFNGAVGADARCNSDGAKPTASQYKAILVDGVTRIASAGPDSGTGQVDWVLFPNTAYFRVDGITPIFTTNAQSLFIFTGGFTLTNSFDTIASLFWTGLTTTWTLHADNCSGWTSNAGNGIRGSGSANAGTALESINSSCGIGQALLCAEQ